MDITVISKGIPSHGVLLLASGDPSFEKNLSAALSNADISETEKLLSAFVINSSQRSVVAYYVRWTLADVNGKTVSHERIYKDLSLLMEHRDKQARDSEGFSIAAGSTRLISLIPFLSNAHQPQDNIGGAWFVHTATEDADSVKHALLDRNTKELGTKMIRDFEHIASITVSLNGAFFDDGTFVGPDESQFFSKVKAQLDARYDVYKRVQDMLLSQKPSDKILRYVTDLASMPRVSLGHSSSPDEFYDFFKRFYGQEISRIWSKSGAQSAIHYVETTISKPWATLKKL
ncbi:MAG TPA: hypothetical protein VN937_04670 [Blastocatellia bacterium]|nr:hypothetical protein [Blastocatellia bacterium]